MNSDRQTEHRWYVSRLLSGQPSSSHQNINTCSTSYCAASIYAHCRLGRENYVRRGNLGWFITSILLYLYFLSALKLDNKKTRSTNILVWFWCPNCIYFDGSQKFSLFHYLWAVTSKLPRIFFPSAALEKPFRAPASWRLYWISHIANTHFTLHLCWTI